MSSGQPRAQGSLIQVDYFDNTGGLNTSDSPFRVLDNQAVSGVNYDYVVTGGFRKRKGHTRLNVSGVDSVTQTLGMFVHTDLSNTKTLLRATSSVLQTINKTTGASTSVTDDTVSAGSSPFSSSTQPVVFTQFNTASNNMAWMAGGGLASATVLGYNGTSYTTNGVAAPTGSISTAVTGSGTMSGSYYYSAALYKASTGSVSNAALDPAVVSPSSQKVNVTLSSITAYDTTKYTQIWIYRSAASGSSGFTVGDLVAKIAYNGTTYSIVSGGGSIAGAVYTDDGTYLTTSQAVPRAASLLLDNSVLPAGTYNVITSYRRRLVTAQGSTVYFSDLNKPESWPANNYLQIPSGGPITALGVINYNTTSVSDVNEILVVFKERECWIVQGNNFTTYSGTADTTGTLVRTADIALLFGDFVGCVAQPLLVNANGYLAWIDYRGVYLWTGSGKPIYCSRPIEYDFSSDGDYDLTNLTLGIGAFLRRQNQIYWIMSSKVYGVNKSVLKMDLRLTLPRVSEQMDGTVLEGVFAKDSLTYNVYGACSSIISASEVMYAGGNEGRLWTMYDNLQSDGGTAVSMTYRTRPLDLGAISTTKRVHKVIAWVQEGSTNNLTLNYWTDYRILDSYKGQMSEQITSSPTSAVWDIALWDNVNWDTQSQTYAPVVFNLNGDNIGTEGPAFTFEFQQADTNTPIIIAGFSVIYSLIGVRA